MRMCTDAFPGLRVADPSYIVSLEGCNAQPVHTDAPVGLCDLGKTPEEHDMALRHRQALDADVVPLSVLIAIHSGSSLLVWPKSQEVIWQPEASPALPAPSVKMSASGRPLRAPKRYPVELPVPDPVPVARSRRILIAPFHACIFRQDLVHAGDAYAKQNTRVHFFLDPSDPDQFGELRLKGPDVRTQYVDGEHFVI